MTNSPREEHQNNTSLFATTTSNNNGVREQSNHGRGAEPTTSSTTLVEAIRHSYRVGLSGGGATLLSVATMMWLHTIVTYQQRHGTKFSETARHLWRDGGPRRFYRGLLPSLAVAPVCRFGDTLSNELAMTLLQGGQDKARAGRASDGEHGGEIVSRALPVWVATFFGSLGAAVFHAAVVPLDTYKTVMQVEGKPGLPVMKQRIALRGPIAAYDGALAFAGGSLMGHYPWYLTYNILEQHMPQPKPDDARGRRTRSAIIGTVASVVSAAASNSFRVLKVYRQSHHMGDKMTYMKSIAQIVQKDGGGARGAMGVFGRGLAGRAAASGMQGLVFNVIWKEINHWSEERESRKHSRE